MEQIGTNQHFKVLAKMGYSARGVVYLVIGGLALLAAFGGGGETTDSKGAILEITRQPFGSALLFLMILGLIGYVVWRFTQAVKDTDNQGTSAKGLAVRAGLLISAISHTALAFWAIKLLIGDETDNDSNGTAESGKALLETEYGQILLGVIGIAVIGVGLAHIFKGWKSRFERYMDIPADKNKWARPICRFGLIARGVVWCVVGWFLIKSAFMASSGEIKGMTEALASLRDAGYGGWVYTIVAAGLVAFGLYSILQAVYRRVDTSGQQ